MLPFIGAATLAMAGSAVITNEYNYLHPTVVHIETVKTVKIPEIKYIKSAGEVDVLFPILYGLESNSGKLLHRPGDTSCATTKNACGHHQLTPIALCQVGYCHKNYLVLRSNKNWSEKRAREYLAWLEKHYPNKSLVFRYLQYQQGPTGIQRIYDVASGKKKYFGKKIHRNVLNNLPKSLHKLPNKGLANAFLGHFALLIEKKRRSLAI